MGRTFSAQSQPEPSEDGIERFDIYEDEPNRSADEPVVPHVHVPVKTGLTYDQAKKWMIDHAEAGEGKGGDDA